MRWKGDRYILVKLTPVTGQWFDRQAHYTEANPEILKAVHVLANLEAHFPSDVNVHCYICGYVKIRTGPKGPVFQTCLQRARFFGLDPDFLHLHLQR